MDQKQARQIGDLAGVLHAHERFHVDALVRGGPRFRESFVPYILLMAHAPGPGGRSEMTAQKYSRRAFTPPPCGSLERGSLLFYRMLGKLFP